MVKQNNVILNFNRGVISELGLARQDIERLSLSASLQNNFMPRVLGSMMLRPGLGYVGATRSNLKAFHIPFVYSNEDTAILEMTSGKMRVIINDVPITKPTITTVINNGEFTSDLSSWTSHDESGCTSSWVGGKLSLVGTDFNSAIRRQAVSVSGVNLNTEHSVKLVVTRGRVSLKIGLSSGTDEIFAKTEFGEGTYVIAFTPATNFNIEISASTKYASFVESCALDAVGDFTLDTPWLEADLPFLRYDQSGDVIYVACKGYIQYKLLRLGSRSWGIEKYLPEDGPFRFINTTKARLTPSAISGDITLTSSTGLFSQSSVGMLFKISSTGQVVQTSIPSPVGTDQWSNSIRVSGVGASRAFKVTLSGTWSGTATLQRSIGEEGSWVDVTTYTSNGVNNYDDDLDNQIIFYRFGVKSGALGSGTVVLSLEYSSGSISGICRITGFTSQTSVSAIVLSPFGSTSASENWYQGYWGGSRGYPTALALHEGRLIHGGQSRIYASASDAYESFDDTIEGDAAAFTKLIPSGPSEDVNWLLSMKRLMIGTQQAEWYLRSSTQDEILTPSNSNMKITSNFGSSPVQAIQLDNVGLFVQKSTTRLMKSGYTIESDDYKSEDLSKIIPEFLISGIVRTASQRMPDTRVHCVLGDGTAAVYIQDELEDVKSWVTVSTDGFIEDVFVMPGREEDSVYYTVRRTVNGNTVRYREKWALETECVGGLANKQADSFIYYNGTPTFVVSGLSHLEGRQVIVWTDGVDLSPMVNGVQTTFTVTGGSIIFPQAYSKVVIGLPYKAQYKSVKIGLGSQLGTSLLQTKKIGMLGVLLVNTHHQGLKYGPDFDSLDDLPLMEDWSEVSDDYIYEQYDEEMFEFDGDWDTDSRICLEAMAPRPCNVLACVIQVSMHEEHDRQ